MTKIRSYIYFLYRFIGNQYLCLNFFSYLFYFWFFVHKVNRVVFALKLASDNVWIEICYPMVPFVVLCQAWTFGPLILLVRKSIGGQYVVPASFGLASAILHSDHIIQIDTYCTRTLTSWPCFLSHWFPFYKWNQLGKSKHISTVPNYSTCQKVIFLANIITVQSSHSELCCLLTSVELHKRGNQWEFSWTDGWLERKKKLLWFALMSTTHKWHHKQSYSSPLLLQNLALLSSSVKAKASLIVQEYCVVCVIWHIWH